MHSDWPFADPQNVAIFSTEAIVKHETPILFVSHDSDDGAWQFHSGKTIAETEPKIVSLKRIVEIDPSVKELADLPLGWIAFRESTNHPWQRSECDRT